MADASNVSRLRLALSLVALFLSSMCTMGDLVISPIVANVYEAFADSPLWLVNLGITGPALIGLPFGLVAGYLCDHADKRVIMIVGFLIFTLSAVFGIAYDNVLYFVAMRLLATGVGWGITNTAAFAILADMFSDDERHARYVGWYNSCMSVLGAILASVAGYLALGGWELAYETYWLAIPVLIMLIAFLPAFPPREAAEKVLDETLPIAEASVPVEIKPSSRVGSVSPRWWVVLVPLTMQVFFVALFYYIILYLIGVYVADKGIGDEAYIGMLTSVLTLSTAAGSFVFGFFYKRMANRVYIPGLAAIALAFFVLAWTDSMVIVAAMLIVAGLGWAFYFCFFYTYCTEIVPTTKTGMATSVVATSNGLAVSASSQVLTYSMAVTGFASYELYPTFGALMVLILVLSILWGALPFRKHK